MNKYHQQSVFLPALAVFRTFIANQVENLRSNNSKNALTLVFEIFSVGSEFKKVSEEYVDFAKLVIPGVLIRTLADKNFIASLAKRSITIMVETCPTWSVCQMFLESTASKSLVLAEFSLQTIGVLVRNADTNFFTNPTSDILILTMCDVIEGKKTRMVKSATPVLLEFKSQLGQETLT